MGREVDFETSKEVGTLTFNKGAIRITIDDKEIKKILDFFKLNPITKTPVVDEEEITQNIVLDDDIVDDQYEDDIEEPIKLTEDSIMELE